MAIKYPIKIKASKNNFCYFETSRTLDSLKKTGIVGVHKHLPPPPPPSEGENNIVINDSQYVILNLNELNKIRSKAIPVQ